MHSKHETVEISFSLDDFDNEELIYELKCRMSRKKLSKEEINSVTKFVLAFDDRLFFSVKTLEDQLKSELFSECAGKYSISELQKILIK